MAMMTDSTEPPVPMPSHAAAKGLALGLGVLLLGGTALLITLLITRGPEPTPPTSYQEALNPGDVIKDVSLDGDRALLLVETADGRQELVLVDVTTLTRNRDGNTRDERSVIE